MMKSVVNSSFIFIPIALDGLTPNTLANTDAAAADAAAIAGTGAATLAGAQPNLLSIKFNIVYIKNISIYPYYHITRFYSGTGSGIL